MIEYPVELDRFVLLLGRPVEDELLSEAIREFGLVQDGCSEEGYLESESQGLSLLYEAGRICAIFFHSEGKDGFSQFRGRLPYGLTYDSTASDVRERLGKADAARGPHVIWPMLDSNGWDRYEQDGFFVHFTYKQGVVEMVTLQSR